jgi:hypothetical protein
METAAAKTSSRLGIQFMPKKKRFMYDKFGYCKVATALYMENQNSQEFGNFEHYKRNITICAAAINDHKRQYVTF